MFIGVQLFGASQAGKLNDNTLAFSDNVVPSLTVVYQVKEGEGTTGPESSP